MSSEDFIKYRQAENDLALDMRADKLAAELNEEEDDQNQSAASRSLPGAGARAQRSTPTPDRSDGQSAPDRTEEGEAIERSAENNSEGVLNPEISSMFQKSLVEMVKDKDVRDMLKSAKVTPASANDFRNPDQMRPAAGTASLTQGASTTLRDTLTKEFGEGWTQGPIGQTMEDFGLLDFVPVADVGLALDDIRNMEERKELGFDVGPAEEFGTYLALPFSAFGLGSVAKAGGKKAGKVLDPVLNFFRGERTADRVLRKLYGGDSPGPQMAKAQAEAGATDEINNALKEFDPEFEWDGKFYRAGEVNKEGPTFMTPDKETAEFYRTAEPDREIQEIEMKDLGRHKVLDLENEEHLAEIERMSGMSLDEGDDIALMVENSLDGYRKQGLDSLVVKGETGAGVEGAPVEVAILNPKLFDSQGSRVSELPDPEITRIEPAEAEEQLQMLQEFTAWAGDDVAQYLPDKTLNINYEYLGTTSDIKAAIDVVGENISTPKKGKTWGDTQSGGVQLANELGLDVKRLKGTWDKLKRLDEDVYAARTVMLNSSDRVRRLAKQYNSSMGSADKAKFLSAVQQHHEIMQYVSGIVATPGRALNSQKIVASELSGNVGRMEEAMNEFGGSGRVDELANAIARADDPETLNKVTRQGLLNKFWDSSTELWVNGLLSGAKTLTVNVTGNSLFTAWQVPERFIQGTVGAMRQGASRMAGNKEAIDRIYAGESLALLYGMMEGFGDALRAGGRAGWTGETSIAGDTRLTELPRQRAISGEEFELTGIPGRAVDLLGSVVRAPSTVMLMQDEFFKTMGRRMELNAQAYRTAMKEGGTIEDKARAIHRVRNNPDKYVDHNVDEFAHYVTFQKELGPMGKKVQSIVNAKYGSMNAPVLKFLVPFLRTPANIFKAGVLERNPVFAGLSREFKDDIKAGGAKRDAALGKLSAGTMISAYAGYQVMQGNITGAGPADRRQREALMATGWKPYSVKVPTETRADGSVKYEYYQYNRAEPLAYLMGATADAVEMMKYMSQDDPTRINETNNYLAMVVGALAENTTNKSFLTGISAFFDAMNNPKMGGADAFVQQYASSAIPNVFRDVREVVGVPGEEGIPADPYIREIEGVKDALKNKIPGLSTDMPPMRNIWGEPIEKDEGWFFGIRGHGLPVTVSEDTATPIDRKIKELAVDGIKDLTTGEVKIYRDALIGKPSRNIQGVRLEPWKYDELLRSVNEVESDRFLDAGKSVNRREALNHLVQKRWFKELEPNTQAMLIGKVDRAFVDAGRQQFIESNEELQKQVDTLDRHKANMLQDLGKTLQEYR